MVNPFMLLITFLPVTRIIATGVLGALPLCQDEIPLRPEVILVIE